MTLLGLWLSFCFVNIIGIGLASGTFADDGWEKASKVSSGALILKGFGMGTFGKFCATVIALGMYCPKIALIHEEGWKGRS